MHADVVIYNNTIWSYFEKSSFCYFKPFPFGKRNQKLRNKEIDSTSVFYVFESDTPEKFSAITVITIFHSTYRPAKADSKSILSSGKWGKKCVKWSASHQLRITLQNKGIFNYL